MLELELHFENGTVRQLQVVLPCDIGRDAQSDLRISAWRVARRHARIEHGEDGAYIEDFGSLSGTWINGRRITRQGPLCPGDEIVIGPCLVRVRSGPGASHKDPTAPQTGACPEHSGSTAAESVRPGDGTALQEVFIPSSEVSDQPPVKSATELAPMADPQLLRHRRRLHTALLEALDLRRRDIASMSDAALRAEATAALFDIIRSDRDLPDSVDRHGMLQEVVNEAVGLGPLEPLLADPDISEIMVNCHDEIYVEMGGKLRRHRTAFSSEQAVLGVIERIVSPLGRRIDESSPMVDARLRDGSRVNAVIPPIALRGASLTIRKFSQRQLLMSDLLQVGALSVAMGDFLKACVVQRKNIIVSGGTGSGKTTLLNILSNCIPASERVVTIEDAAELRLAHQNLVTLEARPPNLEGRGRIDIRDLVRNALRMRPDRIVIGECRGAETFDMLGAMNTGHEGSLTTLHANSPRDALSRLETMILMAGMDLPLAAVREHIAASIQILVQQARLSDGRRLITSIVEVTGMESGRIQTQELFRYHAGRDGRDEEFHGCGIVPECLSAEGLIAAGLSADLFSARAALRNRSATFSSSAKTGGAPSGE
jgi:pilus assembly protein CpaF